MWEETPFTYCTTCIPCSQWYISIHLYIRPKSTTYLDCISQSAALPDFSKVDIKKPPDAIYKILWPNFLGLDSGRICQETGFKETAICCYKVAKWDKITVFFSAKRCLWSICCHNVAKCKERILSKNCTRPMSLWPYIYFLTPGSIRIAKSLKRLPNILFTDRVCSSYLSTFAIDAIFVCFYGWTILVLTTFFSKDMYAVCFYIFRLMLYKYIVIGFRW